MNPEVYIRNNECGIPAGDYFITQATGNYGISSEEIYYNINVEPVKDHIQLDPIRQRIKEDIERMYGNYDGSYVNMYNPFRTTVFSSSMQKLDMSAFDIENIYVNEEKGTIVVKWGDGVTTKVKLEKGDAFDLEAGVSFALLKRLLISHHHLQRVIKEKVIYSEKEESCSEKEKKISE